MFTFLITGVIIVIIGIAVYFWQKPAPGNGENILPPQPNARGLFAEDPLAGAAEHERLAIAERKSSTISCQSESGRPNRVGRSTSNQRSRFIRSSAHRMS